MIWSVVIFFAVLVIDLVTDFRRFKKGEKINHLRGLLLRIIGLVPSVYLLPHDRILGAGLEAILYLALFNGVWGLMIKRNWFYLGSTSKMDIIQKKLGAWGFVIQYIILIVLFYFYFK